MSELDDMQKLLSDLDVLLTKEVATPCSYHPAGRNSLFLNPLERGVILARIGPRIQEWHLNRIEQLGRQMAKELRP
jgi:hypothetical protein